MKATCRRRRRSPAGRIAGQDVEPAEGSDGTDGHWRIAQQVAPDRVTSTVDPGRRHVHKTVHRRQDGLKAHLAVEPDTGIITDCALTKANGSDNREAVVGLALLDGEDSPVTALADSAYGSGQFRAEMVERGHVDRVKPAPTHSVIPGGSPSMTSPLTTIKASWPAPPGSSVRSRPPPAWCSKPPAVTARFATAAPPASLVAP
jgi:Transposase DDE domain